MIRQKLQSRYKKKNFFGFEIHSITRITLFHINFLSLACDIKLKSVIMFFRPEADYRKAQTFSGNANERSVSIRSNPFLLKNSISMYKKKEGKEGNNV